LIVFFLIVLAAKNWLNLQSGVWLLVRSVTISCEWLKHCFKHLLLR
jgi:hypothetical protein